MGAITHGKNSKSMGMRNLLTRERDLTTDARKAVQKLAEDHPYVFELLGGCPAEGTEAAIEPGTITFFCKDGELRFSANVNSMMLKFHGVCQDVLNPWGAINTALAMGDVTPKEITERPYTPKNATALPH